MKMDRNIVNLPKEVLEIILLHLDFQSLGRCFQIFTNQSHEKILREKLQSLTTLQLKTYTKEELQYFYHIKQCQNIDAGHISYIWNEYYVYSIDQLMTLRLISKKNEYVSVSIGSFRALALDKNGNLFVSDFGHEFWTPTPRVTERLVENKEYQHLEADLKYFLLDNGISYIISCITSNDIRHVIQVSRIKEYLFHLNSLGQVSFNKDVHDYNTLNIKNIIQISSTDNHLLSLNNKGEVYLFEYDHINEVTPILIYFPRKIIALSAKWNLSIFLDIEGNVYYFKGKSKTPVQILELNNIIEISAGYKYSLAMDKLGRIYSFTDNNDIPKLIHTLDILL